jgi:hypothetical protein
MSDYMHVDAVNAAEDGEGVCVSLRIDGEWLLVRMYQREAVTLADMLRLLTRTRD